MTGLSDGNRTPSQLVSYGGCLGKFLKPAVRGMRLHWKKISFLVLHLSVSVSVFGSSNAYVSFMKNLVI